MREYGHVCVDLDVPGGRAALYARIEQLDMWLARAEFGEVVVDDEGEIRTAASLRASAGQLRRLVDYLSGVSGFWLRVTDADVQTSARRVVEPPAQSCPRPARCVFTAPTGGMLVDADIRSCHAWEAAVVSGDRQLLADLLSDGAYARLVPLAGDLERAKVALLATINGGGMTAMRRHGVADPVAVTRDIATRYPALAAWRRPPRDTGLWHRNAELLSVESDALSRLHDLIGTVPGCAMVIPMYDGALCSVPADTAEESARTIGRLYAWCFLAALTATGAELARSLPAIPLDKLVKLKMGPSWGSLDTVVQIEVT